MTTSDNQRMLVFRLGEQSWSLDLDQLTLNDQIHLEQHAGRSWGRLLAAFYDDRDTLALKTLWWAARRASGELLEFTDRAMNPRACELGFAVYSNEAVSIKLPAEPAPAEPEQVPGTTTPADLGRTPATADEVSTIGGQVDAAVR